MAIDKSRTPSWMKGVLIFMAAVFVLSFVGIAANPFALFSQQPGTTPTATDPVSAANQRFQPGVNALTGQLQSDPESYTVLVQLGNAYYDWALEIQKASQTTSAAAGADKPLWVAAKDAYSRAVKVNAGESPVMVDYSITQFYSGDTNGAIATASTVTKADPNFAPAWFNLGIYYRAVSQPDKAISALERYVKLDPQGKQGDVNYAKQQLQELKSGTK